MYTGFVGFGKKRLDILSGLDSWSQDYAGISDWVGQGKIVDFFSKVSRGV